MGNRTTYRYDANNNTVSGRTEGELVDAPGSGANVRLAETTAVYDALDRPIQADVDFFDPETQAPIGDGLSTTNIEYSASFRGINFRL